MSLYDGCVCVCVYLGMKFILHFWWEVFKVLWICRLELRLAKRPGVQTIRLMFVCNAILSESTKTGENETRSTAEEKKVTNATVTIMKVKKNQNTYAIWKTKGRGKQWTTMMTTTKAIRRVERMSNNNNKKSSTKEYTQEQAM